MVILLLGQLDIALAQVDAVALVLDGQVIAHLGAPHRVLGVVYSAQGLLLARACRNVKLIERAVAVSPDNLTVGVLGAAQRVGGPLDAELGVRLGRRQGVAAVLKADARPVDLVLGGGQLLGRGARLQPRQVILGVLELEPRHRDREGALALGAAGGPLSGLEVGLGLLKALRQVADVELGQQLAAGDPLVGLDMQGAQVA